MVPAKKYLIASIVGIVLFSIVAGISLSQTGYFSKAFSKTIQPNQMYQQNVSIRKYYNLTVRFRTSSTGSDLTFSDPDATVIIRDANGNELFRVTGVSSGKNYSTQDKLLLDAIAFADSSSVDAYADNFNQSVVLTYSGTKAYLTIIVAKASGIASVQGLIYDELTAQNLQGITVSAYNSSLDPTASAFAATNQTDAAGNYILVLPADSGGSSYDFYISDYSVSP